MDEFMLEAHYRNEDRDRDFLPYSESDMIDEMIRDGNEAMSGDLDKSDEVHNSFICKNSYIPTQFTKTDYRLTVNMSDGCYECYVYEGSKNDLFDGYWVKTKIGYELMDDSQIDRMYLC